MDKGLSIDSVGVLMVMGMGMELVGSCFGVVCSHEILVGMGDIPSVMNVDHLLSAHIV